MTARRRKPGEARGRTPFLLPPAVGRVWTDFVDELGATLADDGRDRGRLYGLAQAAREQMQWPAHGLGDEYLIGGVIRLAWAYSMADETRRGWLRGVLIPLHDVIEGMVDTASSPSKADREAMAAAAVDPASDPGPPAPPQAPTPPEPGQPGWRADLHG
jgi:hypothetical protein